MKRFISVIFAVLMMSGIPAHAMTTEPHDDEIIWNLVEEYSPNDMITATITACAKFESGCKSNAISGYYLFEHDISKEMTEKIDKGMHDDSSKVGFLYGRYGYGYGLLQWNSYNEHLKLYEFAQAKTVSIGDAALQVEFIFWDLQNNFIELWEQMITEDDMNEVIRIFSVFYMGTTQASYISVRECHAKELCDLYS